MNSNLGGISEANLVAIWRTTLANLLLTVDEMWTSGKISPAEVLDTLWHCNVTVEAWPPEVRIAILNAVQTTIALMATAISKHTDIVELCEFARENIGAYAKYAGMDLVPFLSEFVNPTNNPAQPGARTWLAWKTILIFCESKLSSV